MFCYIICYGLLLLHINDKKEEEILLHEQLKVFLHD